MPRSCGECAACCVVLEVISVGKDAGERCKALAPSGCGMYSTRPAECRKFQCVWHTGKLPEDHRPDKLGILFHHLSKSKLRNELFKRFNITVYVAREVIPGAFGDNEFLLNILSQSHILILKDANERSIYRGPPEALAFSLDYIKKRK